MNVDSLATDSLYLAQQLEQIIEIEKELFTLHFWQQLLLALGIIVGQILLFMLLNKLFIKLKSKLIRMGYHRLKPIMIKEYEFLTVRRQAILIGAFIKLIKWTLALVQLIFSVPLLFSVFPQTKRIAMILFGYIINPIKQIGEAIIDYLPNLFFIILIWITTVYIIKGIAYMANEIQNGKLKITGFYPDWAHPTYSILRFLLYAFMIAMIYPYLPGADSNVFQGVSVFLGLMVSLGSTSVIGNVMAGLVITYMRPFKIGDRIKLNDTIGNVLEKTPLVTRIKTIKNEIVTIPNSVILSSQSVNYSASAETYHLLIYTSVTIGYDAPWRKVHQLLIDAAKATEGVLNRPEPFVLELELSDFYIEYQINISIKDANKAAHIKSRLHQNIQDKFNEAGVEIMSPHYRVDRLTNETTIPKEYHNRDENN